MKEEAASNKKPRPRPLDVDDLILALFKRFAGVDELTGGLGLLRETLRRAGLRAEDIEPALPRALEARAAYRRGELLLSSPPHQQRPPPSSSGSTTEDAEGRGEEGFDVLQAGIA